MMKARTIALLAVALALLGGCQMPNVRGGSTERLSAERQSRGPWFEQFPEGESRLVRFENEGGYLDTLALRERNEQVRDWMFASLAAAYGGSPEETASAVGALRIRRVEDPSSRSQQRGPVRWCVLENGDVVALVPAEDPVTGQRRVATLLDSIRFERSSLSGKVHTFEYSIDPDLPRGRLTRLPSADVSTFYSPDGGYYTAKITSPADLEAFFDKADDLTEARVEAGHLVLAGRAGLLHDAGARMTLAHAAEIYQADARWRVPRARINSLVSDFNARYGHFSGTPEEVARMKDEAQRQGALIDKLKQVEDQRPDKRIGCGFSLDTKPERSNNPVYQEARYDCDLAGTESGMVLFYGDLTAKLWALNISHEFPWAISGFVPEIAARLSERDQARVDASPWTRIWFGPRQDRFSDTSGTLNFAPVATRVYARSFTAPGARETDPNPATASFVDWWNAHYDEVSRWEPEFGRLNELMKWSVLTAWVEKHHEGESLLNFLDEQPVRRDRWFPDWARQQGARLAFTSWEDANFERRGSRGSTESLAVLSSDTVVEGNRARTIVGGVSLGTPDDLDPSKKKSSAPTPKTTVRSVAGGAEAQSAEGTTRFQATRDKATIANGQGQSGERLEITPDKETITVRVFLDHSRPRTALLNEAKNGLVADGTLANAVVDAVIRKGDSIYLHIPGVKGFSRTEVKRTLDGGPALLEAGPEDLGRLMSPGETLVVKKGGVSQHGFQAEIRREAAPPTGLRRELLAGGFRVPVVDQQGELHLARDSIPPDLLSDPDLLRRLISSAGAPQPVTVQLARDEPESGRDESKNTQVLGSDEPNSTRLLPISAPLTGRYLLQVARIIEAANGAAAGPVYYEVRRLPEPDWDPALSGVTAARARTDYGKKVSATLPPDVHAFPWAIRSGGKTYVRVGEPGSTEPYQGKVAIAYLRTQ